MPKSGPPTKEEIAAAQDVIRRAAAAEQRERDARLKPLRDIVSSASFRTVHQQVQELPVELRMDESLAPHVMAINAGLRGLSQLVPGVAEEPGASQPE
jgi:hypothetical protein